LHQRKNARGCSAAGRRLPPMIAIDCDNPRMKRKRNLADSFFLIGCWKRTM
jgi:hypothetical protein